MDKIIRMPKRRLPVWRIVAVGLAVFFLVMGSSKLLTPRAGMPGDFGPLTAWIGAAELAGGLMLLVPGLVAHAAFFLVPVVCLIALVGSVNLGREVALPTAVIVAALVALGHARRPGALLRARLDRALERFVRLESARAEGVHHEGS